MAATSDPPPWQNDLQRAEPRSLGVVAGPKFSLDALGEAYRHIKQVAPPRGDCDLYDLLSSTRREETYQPYFAGWPGLLRPLSPALFDLPAMVQEKYRTCQTMCFCGLFPQIKRAWASIDNSLFLWRYDKSGDIPVEYCGEEQAICAVGLVKPRAGVFLEAIQHAIVLCTTTEIVMLGVCPTRRGGSGGARGAASDGELTLQPLPLYAVPSDNVVMTCVASSARGRVFLGGSDGHLYELQYAATDSWGRKRCQKVRLTGRLQQLLPSFLPSMLGLGGGGAVERLVVDDERCVLYALVAGGSGCLQVFDLGAGGADPAKKVAECSDFYAAAAGASGGRDTFRNPAGEKKSAAIKHLAPISMAESTKLHLLVVAADGRRVFFTTHHLRAAYYGYGSGGGSSGSADDPAKARPTTLVAVFARQAPPHTNVPLGRDLARPAALEVVAAHYSGGTLLLSEASGADGRTTKLLLAGRNHTLPLAAVNVGASGGAPGLREALSELDNFVPGEACAIEACPAAPPLGPEVRLGGPQDELAAQLYAPPPRYALISTAGCVELERRRPLDLLAAILEERSPGRLRHFFDAYGPVEAAAMCVAVAAARPGTLSSVAVREAAAALENAALVGEPRMPEDVPQPQDMGGAGVMSTGAGGIYMGQAVNPNPEPDWSAAHRGLCAYAARLLAPVWEGKLVTAGADGLLHCRLSHDTMAAVVERLRCLDAFLGAWLNQRAQRGHASRYSPARGGGGLLGAGYAPQVASGGGLFGAAYQDAYEGAGGAVAMQAAKRQRLSLAAQLEDERSVRVRGLVGKACEALVLLQLLAAHNLGRLAVRLDERARRTLAGMSVRDLVYDADGEGVAAALISVLVSSQLDTAGAAGAAATGGAAGSVVAGVEEVGAALARGCPSYFREDDRTFYRASAQLKAAEAAATPADREALVREALGALRRVPLAANLEMLASQLAYLRAYDGLVDIPLRAAAASDPENLAMRPELGPDCERARQRRQAAYHHIFATLRMLVSGSGNPGAAAAAASGGPAGAEAQKGLSAQERAAYKAAILKASLASPDLFFHACLYDALIDMGDAATLLGCGAPHLEPFLAEHSGLGPAAAPAAVMAGPGAVPPAGPLTRRQVGLGELLAKHHVAAGRFHAAAAVYGALAGRKAGPGDTAVRLEERVAALQAAVLQAKSAGDGALTDRLAADARLMRHQADIAARLEERRDSGAAAPGSPEAAELARQVGELQAGLRDVSELYNDYAQPHRLWDVCLQLIAFAGGAVEPALVRQLWDHALLAAVDAAVGGDSGPARVGRAAALVERLGAEFYPSEASFPAPHVAFRLEQLAAGLWPAPATAGGAAALAAGDQSEVVAGAMLRACRSSLPAAQRVYESLLSRRAAGAVPGLEAAPLRLRVALLRSLAVLCGAAADDLTSALVTPGLAGAGGVAVAGGTPGSLGAGGAQRELGGLMDVCERAALEARRLGSPEADALAGTFDALRRRAGDALAGSGVH